MDASLNPDQNDRTNLKITQCPQNNQKTIAGDRNLDDSVFEMN
jgi:hypothetical protein